jgi:hypothetical protein
VPRHVERDQAVLRRDLGIIHQVAPLPGIRARRVQAQNRAALPCAFKIDALAACLRL